MARNNKPKNIKIRLINGLKNGVTCFFYFLTSYFYFFLVLSRAFVPIEAAVFLLSAGDGSGVWADSGKSKKMKSPLPEWDRKEYRQTVKNGKSGSAYVLFLLGDFVKLNY